MSLNVTVPSISLVLVLVAVVGIAVWTDIKRFRIPNLVTTGGAALGMLLHTWHAGADGLTISLAGLAVGLCAFLPLYVIGGVAAGDVKLMAAVGSFLGPIITLVAVLCTLMCGGLLAVGVILSRRMNSGGPAYNELSKIEHDANAISDITWEDCQAREFAYAPAIALGTFVTLCWVAI